MNRGVVVVLISAGVFLGLAGEQWRESARHRALAEASLRRFRSEILTNRKAVAAVKDYVALKGTWDLRRGIGHVIAGAIVTAAVSTLGDYLWANVLPHHRPLYGLAHGTLLFLTVGWCLGLAARRPITGAAGGAAIGFSAAAG